MVIRQYIGISGDWTLLEYIQEHLLWENLYYSVNREGYECKRKTLFVWEMFYSAFIAIKLNHGLQIHNLG